MKAIIFDLDGVLVDACDWHYHSLNDALEHFKGFKISHDEHMQKYNGLPTSKKLEMLNITDAKEKDDIWKMKQERTISNIKKYGFNDKYKIKMLSKLKQDGLMLACVTNSIRLTALEMLEITGQHEFMDIIITNEDVENNKPSPDCYLLAFEMLGITKEECIIVEDSPKGRQAAHASGAKVLEVEDVYDVTYDNIRRNI